MSKPTPSPSTGTKDEQIHALHNLRVGVELDRHNLDDGEMKLAALDAAIAALAAQAQPADATADLESRQQWLPIETAPRDGTDVLLLGHSGEIANGHVNEVGRWVWPYFNREPLFWQSRPPHTSPADRSSNRTSS